MHGYGQNAETRRQGEETYEQRGRVGLVNRYSTVETLSRRLKAVLTGLRGGRGGERRG